MLKHDVSMQDIKERNIFNEKMNNSEEESSDDDDKITFNTRKEGQEYYFRMIQGEDVSKKEKRSIVVEEDE